MDVKLLVFLMVFNSFFLLENTTRVSQLEPLTLAFNLTDSAARQMMAGEVRGGLDCTVETARKNKPKKNVKVRLGGYFEIPGGEIVRFRQQVAKTGADGRAQFRFDDDLEAFLDLLDELDELEDYATCGKFEGTFLGAKPIDSWSLNCRALGDRTTAR